MFINLLVLCCIEAHRPYEHYFICAVLYGNSYPHVHYCIALMSIAL
jgi:hypothetical protein